MDKNSPFELTSPHSKETEEVLRQLETDADKGLAFDDVQNRLKKYGRNKLKEHKEKSIWQILVDQLTNPIVYLLVTATIIAFFFGDIPEAVAIMVVIILNTIIGFWMEYQARKSMKQLEQMDKITARVLREGEINEIDAEELVPGDILILESGDLVAADSRLFKTSELATDESPLTGESLPVDKTTEKLSKDTQVADRKNMVYKATAVTNGTGKAVVVATGMNTEIGNISEMVSEAEEESVPLDKKLQKLTKRLIWLILGLAALFFVFGFIAGKTLYLMVQTAIAWAIAAIPEGLPIVASIALSRGMLRLARQHVIVKKLSAVETLGETTVIFSDKTGTLTENKLSVNTFYLPDHKVELKWKKDSLDLEIDEQSEENLVILFKIGVLCNNAQISESESENKDESESGDPLEVALLRFAKAFDQKKLEKLRELPKIEEDPFDSETMVMGTAHQENGHYFISVKGATEAILNRSVSSLKNGDEVRLEDQVKDEWKKRNDELAEYGLRVIAMAYKKSDQKPQSPKDHENGFMKDLVFAGLVGFLDPPRDEVAEAIETCKNAGIKVVMVTGDHPGTAVNIAKKVSLLEKTENNEERLVLHGKKLQKDGSNQKISDIKVFARVDPAQKLKIIDGFQKDGEIVAMTGDGVNDAPALKKADIGIAMGQRGTQVAREVADMVLQDDSFPSIVHAVEQGRIIFGNIRKFVIYQLSYHLSEIIVIGIISFTVFHLPLLPLQLLFLNLLSDVFPALALGVGEGIPGIMKQKPKAPEEPIITKNNWYTIGLYGTILSIYVSGAYFYAWYLMNLDKGICNNIAFFSLALAQLWHVFNMRDKHENFWNNQVTRNKYIWMALLFCVVVLITAYVVPFLSNVLSFQRMGFTAWLLVIITSLLPLITIQLIISFRK